VRRRRRRTFSSYLQASNLHAAGEAVDVAAVAVDVAAVAACLAESTARAQAAQVVMVMMMSTARSAGSMWKQSSGNAQRGAPLLQLRLRSGAPRRARTYRPSAKPVRCLAQANKTEGLVQLKRPPSGVLGAVVAVAARGAAVHTVAAGAEIGDRR